MITPNWVKQLTKIDDEDLFIDERKFRKASKFYEANKNVPKFVEDIKSEVDEGFADYPEEPIYHRFPRWFSESEEFSESLANICKNNIGSEDYMKIWYMMNTALACLISGKVYSLNAMEGEYEDEAYQVFVALMKHIANDYSNFSKKFRVTDNLSEANKYFFGTENPKEVKKLFESYDNNYDYYNIISKLEKGSSLTSYMHPGYYENWVTGPSLSTSDVIINTGIGFGWISSLAKTGTKGDRMKFHVYTNEPELLEKLRQHQYLETEFTAYSETPLFSSNDFSLVETLCEYLGVDASEKDTEKYIKEYLKKLSGKNIDAKKQLSIIKTFFRNIIETENDHWYTDMIINTRPRKKLRVERDILYRLIGAYVDSSFVEDNKSWILENFGDIDNLSTFLDNDWSLRALFTKTLDELFKKYDKNVPKLWQKNIETLSIFMWGWTDHNSLRTINSVKEYYPDWKKLLKVIK